MKDNFSVAGNCDDYMKYGPNPDNKTVDGTETAEVQGVPLDMSGQTKKVIFQFYNQDPEMGRVKPLFGKVSRRFIIIEYILFAILAVEWTILGVMEQGMSRVIDWFVAGFVVMAFLLPFVIMPARRRKAYRERVTAGEMSYLYTFFEDCVILKNNSMELNLKYDTAQFYAENKEAIVVGFQYGKSIVVDKTTCTAEQVDFIRNIVPKGSMDKTKKKTAVRMTIRIIVAVICVVVAGIYIYKKYNYYPDRTEYVCTTYVSFYDCVSVGLVKDIVIIDNTFIEYTFTGNGTDERYYTVYKGNIDDLVHFFDRNHTNWEFK